MSRVYHKQPGATARQPTTSRPPIRPSHPTPPTTSTNRGTRAPTRGRTMHTQPPRQERPNHILPNEEGRPAQQQQQERTVHNGDGFHMITPSITKREQIMRQAENEQRQYKVHVEQTRLRNIHEVHRLGGDTLSEDEVRQRQAEKYRREKFTRLEKSHQDQLQRKQEEGEEIEARKQAARFQSIENEKRDRNNRPVVDQSAQGATGWTDKDREEDRRKTMNQFLDRFTQQYDGLTLTSDEDTKPNHPDPIKSEKLRTLQDALPHIPRETLEQYLEIYNGNVDKIVDDLLNET